MKNLIAALMITVPAIVQPVFGQERASTEEAKAMALEAAAFIESHGREAAITAFHTPGGTWHDRDLYVFALTGKGVLWAHGVNQNLLGKDLLDLTDVSGKEHVKEFLAIEAEGWVDYLWENPLTEEIELKSSYIVRVSGDSIVGVGAYR